MGIDLGRTDIGKELHAAPERSQGLHCGLLTAWVFFGAVGAGEGVFAGITHRAEQDAVAGTPQLIILRTQGIAVGLQTGDTADYIIIMERVPKFLCDPLQYLDTFVDDCRTNSIPAQNGNSLFHGRHTPNLYKNIYDLFCAISLYQSLSCERNSKTKGLPSEKLWRAFAPAYARAKARPPEQNAPGAWFERCKKPYVYQQYKRARPFPPADFRLKARHTFSGESWSR